MGLILAISSLEIPQNCTKSDQFLKINTKFLSDILTHIIYTHRSFNNNKIIIQNYKSKSMRTPSIMSSLLIILFIVSSESIKFAIEITGMERFCFYEVLGESQKYSVELVPKNQPKYELEISQSDSKGGWKNLYYKMASVGYERMEVHKLAPASTTFSICIKNIQRQPLNLSVKFQSGVQLMEFQLLPDKSDTENIDREIAWIESQKKTLYDTIRQVEHRKADNQNSSSLLSTKMIIFAIIGLISVVVVNFLFFKQVKKTFKERKLM